MFEPDAVAVGDDDTTLQKAMSAVRDLDTQQTNDSNGFFYTSYPSEWVVAGVEFSSIFLC